MAKLFDDSKTFVDMSLKESPEKTMDKFNELMKNTGNNPSGEEVQKFVNVSINIFYNYYIK